MNQRIRKKKTICNGGCKKGDCTGDCKRNISRLNPESIEHNLPFDLLGETIRNARLEKHMSRKELGRLIGIKESQIYKIETMFTFARFDSIIKVFKVLDVKMSFSIVLPDQTVTLR